MRDQSPSNKPIRIFRILGMGVLILMLLGVMVPVGYMVSYEDVIGGGK